MPTQLMGRFVRVLISILMCAAPECICVGAQGAKSKTLKCAQGRFSINYPAAWYGHISPVPGVEVVNYPPDMHVSGVLIPEGGAMITVIRRPKNASTVGLWIRQDLGGIEPEVERDIEAPTSAACGRTTEVRWRWEVGPEVYFHETAYYCVARSAVYHIQLTNWADDPHSLELRSVAERVLRSLRTW
jgi:hypothetical protein